MEDYAEGIRSTAGSDGLSSSVPDLIALKIEPSLSRIASLAALTIFNLGLPTAFFKKDVTEKT